MKRPKKKKKMADQMAVGIHLGKKEDVSPIITWVYALTSILTLDNCLALGVEVF